MQPVWSEMRRAAAAVSEFRYVEAGAIARGAMPDGIDVDRLRAELAVTGAHRNDTRMIEMAVAVDVARMHLAGGTSLPVLADIGKGLLELGRRTGNGAHLARAEGDLRAVIANGPDPATRDRARHDLADLLQTVARWGGRAEPAHEAERLFADLSAAIDRESRPEAWAWATNAHATCLETLARLTGDEERAWDAVDAYERVLGFWTREAFPDEWATARNNLGSAFRDMASRYGRDDLLDRAVAAFEDALLVWKRGSHPSDWAMATSNLGLASAQRALRSKDATALGRACGILREARSVRSLQASPAEWREITTHLARASAEAWRIGGDKASARAAARHYAEALLVLHGSGQAEPAATLGLELEALRREALPAEVGKAVGITVGAGRPPGARWAWCSAFLLAAGLVTLGLAAVLGNQWLPVPVLALLCSTFALWRHLRDVLAARMRPGTEMTREGFRNGRKGRHVRWVDCREVGWTMPGGTARLHVLATETKPGERQTMYVIELGGEAEPVMLGAIANALVQAGRMRDMAS